MKNRLLLVTRNTVPYVKELKPYAQTVGACILMQQLDYWFSRSPDGFYKFLEPCKNAAYREEDSWTEELGLSPDEFRTAFDKIGYRYYSKKQYLSSPKPFISDGVEKFYCSYHDKIRGTTRYLRNDTFVDNVLDAIAAGFTFKPAIPVNRQRQSTEIGKGKLRKQATPIPINSETTTETTTENNLEEREFFSDRALTGGELNILIELTQESECAIAEEFSNSKEDSLTKKKAETRSQTFQQSKPILDESMAKDSEIKTPTPLPPSPRVDRPTKKSKNPLDALTETGDGWLVAPTSGTYKLAGIITLRRMQYAIASTFIDESYEFEFDEDGELCVQFKGEDLTWQEFEKDYPIGKLRNIALHDPAASGILDAEWWNDTLKEFFLETVDFCKWSKDALNVSRSQPASVLFGDIEPDDDED